MGHLRFDNAPQFCNNILQNLQMFFDVQNTYTVRFCSNVFRILLTTGADVPFTNIQYFLDMLLCIEAFTE